MTTLYDLQKNDWNYFNVAVIEEFLYNPRELILTVFFKKNELTCLLDFPSTPFIDLTYFIRPPMEIFRPDTFHDKILFGTINETIDGTILSVLENIYGPIFFSNTTWPDSILFYLYYKK